MVQSIRFVKLALIQPAMAGWMPNRRLNNKPIFMLLMRMVTT